MNTAPPSPPPPSSPPPGAHRWSRRVATLVTGVSAALAAGSFTLSWGWALPAAFAAAPLTWLMWNRMVWKGGDVSLAWAAVLGVFVVLLAYPIMVVELFVASYAWGVIEGRPDDVSVLVRGLILGPVFAVVFGLLATGWFTIPIGVVASVAVAYGTRRAARRQQATGVAA